MASRRSISQAMFEWLLAGGALIALLSGVFDYFKVTRALEATRDLERCKAAREALMDDRLNADLSAAQRKQFLASQLKLALNCAKSGA